MPTPIDLAELRLRMSVQLAVAPKFLLRALANKGTPDAHDRARHELVAFLTQGWDRMNLKGLLTSAPPPRTPIAIPVWSLNDRELVREYWATDEAPGTGRHPHLVQEMRKRNLYALFRRYGPMCNDYERYIEWQAYQEALRQAELPPPSKMDEALLTFAADVRIGDTAPVLVAKGNGAALAPLKWGFKPKRPNAPPVFNFRSEGRRFAESQRCLVPASGFFEFTGRASPKAKWRFWLRDHPVFAVAGLWRYEEGAGPAFTMLTTAPGPDISPFHDRQIVVLPPSAWADWLYLSRPESEVLAPLPKGALRVELAREGREAPPEELMSLSNVT